MVEIATGVFVGVAVAMLAWATFAVAGELGIGVAVGIAAGSLVGVATDVFVGMAVGTLAWATFEVDVGVLAAVGVALGVEDGVKATTRGRSESGTRADPFPPPTSPDM